MLYSLKSRKTFEKLHSDELNINFSFEYDTEEKMDSAFKNFCGEYIDSEFRSTKNNFSPKKVFFLEEKLQIQEKEKESDLWSLLEDKIKTSLKKTDNPVTKYFKNPLIAAVIESLIIKTVEKTFQIKVHMENREDLIPPKMMQMFDISSLVLSAMQSKEEKMNYIIQCMSKNIDDSLDKWTQRLYHQEKKDQEFNLKYEQDKQINFQEKRDVFEWLKIKSKYECLKKRLRAIIIEKMNDYENQQLINTSIANSTRKSLTLNKIPKLTLQTVLSNMNSGFKTKNISHLSQKIHNILSTKTTTEYDEPEIPVMNYKWDTNREKDFRIKRKIKKNLYNEEIKCSNFLEIAFLPLVQENYISMKKDNDRMHILSRYAEGEWLTKDELKFLSDTSSLLNSCVDKKFLQESVHLLSPDVIHNLELFLSENILVTYEKLKNVIKNARFNFLVNLNKEKMNNIQEKTKKILNEQLIKKKAEDNKKFRSTLKNIVLKMEKNGKFIDKAENDIKLYAKMFVEKITNKLKKKTDKIKSPSPPKPKEKKQLIILKPEFEMKKRSYHPSSKLFCESKDEFEKHISPKEKQKMIETYKLFLKSPPYAKISSNFTKFYSGGPLSPPRYEPFWSPYDPKKPIIATPSEIKKIIILQKFFRRYICKMRLKEMKENKVHFLKRKIMNKYNNKSSPSPSDRFFNTIRAVTNEQKLKLKKEVKSAFLLNSPITSPHLAKRKFSASRLGTAGVSTQASVLSLKLPSSISNGNLKSENNEKKLKGLTKHRKLLEYCQNNQAIELKNSGFSYTKGDINFQDNFDNTGLYYAAINSNKEICDFLLRLGADVNIICENGNTALHMAFKSSSLDIIMKMIKYGANLQITNKNRKIPIEMANERFAQQFRSRMLEL